MQRDEYKIPPGGRALVRNGMKIDNGMPVIRRGKNGNQVVAAKGGEVIREDNTIIVRYNQKEERVYEVPAAARLRVEDGQKVRAGDQLTEGSRNPHRLLSVLGREVAELYMVEEVQRVYRSQGVNIHDKHIEIIVSQMLRRVRVRTSGDTDLLPGEILDRKIFEDRNAKIVETGGTPASAQPIILGLTRSALATESFLAAASFQETSRVLTDAAVRGRVDQLRGLKESVILGKLIPVGSGFDPGAARVDLGPAPTVTVDDISEESAESASLAA